MGGTLFSMTAAAVGGLMGLREQLTRFGDYRAWAIELAAALHEHGIRTFPEVPHIATFLAYAPGTADEVNERVVALTEERGIVPSGLWRDTDVPGWVETELTCYESAIAPRSGRGGWFDGCGHRGDHLRRLSRARRSLMGASMGVRRAAALGVLACTSAFGMSSSAHAAGDLCDTGVVFDGADVLEDRVVARAARSAFGDEVTVKVIAWDRVPRGWQAHRCVVRRPRRSAAAGASCRAARGRCSCSVSRCATGSSAASTTAGRSTASTARATTWRSTAWDRPSPTAGGPTACWPGWRATPTRTPSRCPTYEPDPDPGCRGDDVSSRPVAAARTPCPGCSASPSDWRRWAGLGVGGTRLRRHLRARAAARASLRAGADEMAQAWFELDESNELIDARVSALPPVSDSGADAIRASHAQAVMVREGATATYLRLSELQHRDDDR